MKSLARFLWLLCLVPMSVACSSTLSDEPDDDEQDEIVEEVSSSQTACGTIRRRPRCQVQVGCKLVNRANGERCGTSGVCLDGSCVRTP